jgi:hypothetical protein
VKTGDEIKSQDVKALQEYTGRKEGEKKNRRKEGGRWGTKPFSLT